MPLAIFLLLLLAAATPAPNAPIFVNGHAWAPFISPMGEPFRARTIDDDTFVRWFSQADRNHDGALTPAELVADGDRFFATLDTNHDGAIDPDELVQYEWEIAPDIQLMSRTQPQPGTRPSPAKHRSSDHWDGLMDEVDRGSTSVGGLQGAARYGLLNLPEPVAAADTNFDRSISLAEFRQAALARFSLLDSARRGAISRAELESLRPALATDRHHKPPKGALDERIGNPLPPGN
jgi:Ca2+-binding EF-hand superfamily protein